LMENTGSIEADMERRRFKSWAVVFESVTTKDNPWNVVTDERLGFDSILECLIKCREEIELILSRYLTALTPLYSGLRALVDRLENFLPTEYKEQARTHLELDLIQSENVEVLEDRCNRYRSTSLGERIC